MPRPTRLDTLFAVAEAYSLRSTCNRLKVGAVIARDGRIIATGYNGPPAGMEHCAHVLSAGNGDPCIDAVHAEVNALVFAAKYGLATDGCEMIVTHAPCHTCAKLIINAGIIRVYYLNEFRDMTGVYLLHRAGVRCS